MIQIFNDSLFWGMAISLLGYEWGVLIKKKWKFALFNPLLIGIVFVIICLKIFRIPYALYEQSAQYLSYLLTPATICLAIPLYQQMELLRNNKIAIMAGIISGVCTSLSSVLLFAVIFGLNHEQYVTLLPKSITTAIGMAIAEELGGVVTITVAVIIVTGVLGNIFAETVCRCFHITEPIAKGVAIGTSSHAVGTTKAMELGEIEGAMSSLSIAVAGLLTVVGASIFAQFL